MDDPDKDDYLHLLMSVCIEPKIGLKTPMFIYDFPESQSALAKVKEDQPPVAERFEAYYKGVELANGFHELTDPVEQSHRFDVNRTLRNKLKLEDIQVDQRFINSLTHGLPECSGVAVGIDRLVMLAINETSIKSVIAFDFENA